MPKENTMKTCFSCKHHANRFNEEPCSTCGEPRKPRDYKSPRWSPRINNYPCWELNVDTNASTKHNCDNCEHHRIPSSPDTEPCKTCGWPSSGVGPWSPAANGFPLFLPKGKAEPKPTEKPEVPAPSTWTFVSTDMDFDGPRIVREAQEAGLEAYEVIREGSRALLMSRSYVERLQAAGIEVAVYSGGVAVHPATPVITQDGKLRLTNAHPTGAALGFVGAESLDRLSARLEAAEKARTKIRTTVKGV